MVGTLQTMKYNETLKDELNKQLSKIKNLMEKANEFQLAKLQREANKIAKKIEKLNKKS